MKDLESRVADLEALNRVMAKQLMDLRAVVDALSRHSNANTKSITAHTSAINTHTVGIASASFISKILVTRFQNDEVLQAITSAQWKARSTHELFSPMKDEMIEESEAYLKKLIGPVLASLIRQ